MISRFFGSRRSRRIAGYRARVPSINARAESLSALEDVQVRAAYNALRERHDNGESLPSLLPETFAVVREAAVRTLGMRHFDEQLIGGMALFEGNIAEMRTGEGKTLTATLPACLEAISGGGVHVVTVNQYLARRDTEWMGVLYSFLGLSAGVNVAGESPAAKAAAYRSDITYGTNNEFGFDYLRDNMRYEADAKIQRDLRYAIVDEVDSILIDEARTPLIISGESEDSAVAYKEADNVAVRFIRAPDAESPGDFVVDEKTREIHLSEDGFSRAEKLFSDAGLLRSGSLYDPGNLPLMHHLTAALRARHLFLRDRDYVVQNDEVVIVDEFTGRLMPGRRWGDNLHQAVEAKERLPIQKENRTLASVSFQNYFRLYEKIAGMTGTALTESEEFKVIYGLEVVDVPTHRKMVRNDELDRVYQTSEAKYRAALEDIRECAEKGQPVLVGTTAIEDSERLSAVLRDKKLSHEVLNAKQHDREAEIIAQAGRPGAITIATNMAGRGTDIVLGGNIDNELRAVAEDDSLSAEVKDKKTEELKAAWQDAHERAIAAGGLKIIGTERHESRRIDNQLRGRSGRQGDPGASVFYLSFEDSLLRIFATRRVAGIMSKLKIEEDEPIEARMVTRTIEGAQRKVEAHNFDIRRQLLEYDDIANEQRHLIYEQREHILTAEDITPIAAELRVEHIRRLVEEHLPPETPEEEWRVSDLEKLLASDFRLHLPVVKWLEENQEQQRDYFIDRVAEEAEKDFAEKIIPAEPEGFARFLRSLILNIIDDHWRAHLSALDGLRMSIGLRGMAQKNPKQEYKREAFEMFDKLLYNIQSMNARVMYALSVRDKPMETPPPPVPQFGRGDIDSMPPPEDSPNAPTMTQRRIGPKIRRNDPCPCGSGKKYKQCCGKL